MTTRNSIIGVVYLLTTVVPLYAAEPASWLGFRGNGSGAADAAPLQLDLNEGGNLAWKQSMPARSVASPIVVGDLVVTTSSGGQDGEQLFVNGVDMKTGRMVWEQSFRATGRPYTFATSANAAPTPVSDGQRIYALFSSNDLVCLSMQGELLWYRGLGRDYPKAGNDIGLASSPTIADGVLVVKVEAQGDAFAAGIDPETGVNLWRIERPLRSNWSSPVVVRRPDDSTEVVLQSGENVIGVDPGSGVTKWEIDAPGSAIPSATPSGEFLFVPGNELIALDVGRSATTPDIAWRNNRLSPENASVVVSGERLYSLKGSVLVCGTAVEGEIAWRKRLPKLAATWATPIVAASRLYVFDQEGKALVVEDRGDSAEIVGEVEFGEPVFASPAVTDGRLIVRGERTLYCFE